MKTILVVNRKGGCGKTMTAITLASALAGQGGRVGLADADGQKSALRWLKKRPATAAPVAGLDWTAAGRIGDAPIIGAGTYADNRSCAVSATGWGEYFIRVGVAHEICARLRSGDVSAQQVSDDVMAEVAQLGGDGGVILVTPAGEAVFSFNTQGMYRGRADSAGLNEVTIFGGEAAESGTPDH